jgi:hypothetical protein
MLILSSVAPHNMYRQQTFKMTTPPAYNSQISKNIKERVYDEVLHHAMVSQVLNVRACYSLYAYNASGARIFVREGPTVNRLQSLEKHVKWQECRQPADEAFFSMQQNVMRRADSSFNASLTSDIEASVSNIHFGAEFGRMFVETLILPQWKDNFEIDLPGVTRDDEDYTRRGFARAIWVKPEHGWFLKNHRSAIPPDTVVLFPVIYTLTTRCELEGMRTSSAPDDSWHEPVYGVEKIGVVLSAFTAYPAYVAVMTIHGPVYEREQVHVAFDSTERDVTRYHDELRKAQLIECEKEKAENAREQTSNVAKKGRKRNSAGAERSAPTVRPAERVITRDADNTQTASNREHEFALPDAHSLEI